MDQKLVYQNWKDVVVYAEKGAQPSVLVETETYKAVIVGLRPGNKLPPHAEGPAIFHFLEGAGQMILGEETFSVQPGMTVIVPNGAIRGIEAETQLALLAVRLPK